MAQGPRARSLVVLSAAALAACQGIVSELSGGDERSGGPVASGGGAGGSQEVGGGRPSPGDGTGGGGSARGGGTAAGGGLMTGGGSATGGGVSSGGGNAVGGGVAADAGRPVGGGGAAGGGSAVDGGGADAGALPRFSFFVTSLVAMRRLSNSENGFGGDLRYGKATGIEGADEICRAVAEKSMPGASAKQWRAFLSASRGGAGGGAINAIDRIGNGPWYDRLGRLVAQDRAAITGERPMSDDTIRDDLPNEDGVPNHNPDGTSAVDDHDTLTGSTKQGTYSSSIATCSDWTALTGSGPMVGHSWPRTPTSARNWMSEHNAPGCAAGVNLSNTSNSGSSVGAGGGYGGIYCFALTP